jgi:hypothetical protein
MPRKPTGEPVGRRRIKSKISSDSTEPFFPTGLVDKIENPLTWNGTVPPKEIDLNQVLYWIELQATEEEIAGSFRVTRMALNRRLNDAFGMNFDQLRTLCSGNKKISLRRYQFALAEKNASMAIWLGKIWLDQKESGYQNDELPAQLKEFVDTIKSHYKPKLPHE